MKTLYGISAWVATHITLCVVFVSALALTIPVTFTWMQTSTVTPLLGVVMFGMGLTLKPTDFKPVVMHPKAMIIGEVSQFVIMPSVAWVLCKVLALPTELALGVILVGCCPGGTASNVICYLSKGDVALSVAMTGVSTLAAPIVTPALVLLLAGKEVSVDVSGMFVSIIQVVILPIALGFAVSHYFRKFSETVTPLLPLISTIAIVTILGIVVGHNAQGILSCSLVVAVAVILHNVLGLLLGYWAGRLSGMNIAQRTAVSIEVGMQNSGLATSLAATHFAMFPMAAIPGAIFSAWHNFSGSIAAHYYRKSFTTPIL